MTKIPRVMMETLFIRPIQINPEQKKNKSKLFLFWAPAWTATAAASLSYVRSGNFNPTNTTADLERGSKRNHFGSWSKDTMDVKRTTAWLRRQTWSTWAWDRLDAYRGSNTPAAERRGFLHTHLHQRDLRWRRRRTFQSFPTGGAEQAV